MYLELCASVIVIFILCHKFWSFHWKRRGVSGPTPWPIVGNIAEHIFARKTMGQVMEEIYRKYDGYPFVGVFRAMSPCLLVRDPEFVNRILVKDQKSFYNNDFFIDKKVDPLFGRNPFVLRDHEWKETRQMLTPGFSSGKMKHIYEILRDIQEEFVTFIGNHPTVNTEGIETRELTKRYTLNSVAKIAFGIDAKTFESYTELSEFMKLADSMLAPGSFKGILLQINAIMPILGTILSIKLVPKDAEHQLIKIVSEVVKHREQNDVKSNDYLQFILDVGKEKAFNNTDIAAHGVTFFLDGYETSSNIFTSLMLHLAMHPIYQEKIRKEITIIEDKDGDISYDTLSNMKWLDACLNETLRLSPIMDIFVKQCTQPYEYTPDNPEFKMMSVKLYPGDRIILPYGLLMKDEKYIKRANEFVPDRMLDKDNINKTIFFPFGNGPRSCIGQRFGMLQIKLGVAEIIKNFEVSVSPKTKLPIKLIPFNHLNEVQDGIWLRYTKITSNA